MSESKPHARVAVGDIVAGLSVALVLVPQALAYAELAGLPPRHGLYAAALPPIAAAFFASSPYLQTGPVAMTSLLTFGALSFAAGTAEYVGLAALLALVVGAARVLIGLARAGWIAYLMSRPVLTGFAAAAAILIVASQLPTALGVEAPAGDLLVRAWWAVRHADSWEPTSIMLSLITAAVIVAGRRVHALFPGVLVAVIIGVIYSSLSNYAGPVVGEIPASPPPISLALPWSSLPLLIIPGGVIALVGFAEASAVARSFAEQDRKPWSPDREFISQGVANVVSAVSGGFPVGGSFSRSSINRLAGGHTRWSGAITGIAVLLFLPVAGIALFALQQFPTQAALVQQSLQRIGPDAGTTFGAQILWIGSWVLGWEFLLRYVVLNALHREWPKWGWRWVPLIEGLYYLQASPPEAAARCLVAILLTRWVLKRRNLLVALLPHAILEIEIAAFLLYQ